MLEALDKYKRTITEVGDIPYKELEYAIVVDFIDYLFDSEYTKYITKKDIKLFRKYLSCVFSKSCLFKDSRVLKETDFNDDTIFGNLSKLLTNDWENLESVNRNLRYTSPLIK